MKSYVHARLSPDEREALDALRRASGRSESSLVRLGVRLAAAHLGRARSAAEVAGSSVGRFRGGPADLSINPKHLNEFGA